MPKKESFLITVYARLEPTTDSVTLQYVPRTEKEDVQIYKDKEATKPFGRFSWWYEGRPTKRDRFVMLNCYMWQLEWLPRKGE